MCFTWKNRKNCFSCREKSDRGQSREENDVKERIENHNSRAGQVCHRRKIEAASPAQEHGSGGVEQTHGPVARAPLETGARCDASHAAHAIADRHGVQRGAGLFLRCGAEARSGDRPEERAAAISRFSGREEDLLLLREPGLPRTAACLEFLPRRIRTHGDEGHALSPAPGYRTSISDLGQAGTTQWRYEA